MFIFSEEKFFNISVFFWIYKNFCLLLKWLEAFSVSLKILTTLYPSNILKYWKKNWNENQHHEQKDLISPFNRLSSGWWSRPVSQLIVRKTTSSELKASTTVILRDSVVKNVYDNIITKSVKHQNTSFSGTKLQIWTIAKNLHRKNHQWKL